MKGKIIFVDIDETICNTPFDSSGKRNYYDSIPILDNIKKINNLYDQGHRIVYYTSRGSVSGLNWLELTQNQLNSWGCKYHGLKCNKPYYDVIIDDKSLRIEEI